MVWTNLNLTYSFLKLILYHHAFFISIQNIWQPEVNTDDFHFPSYINVHRNGGWARKFPSSDPEFQTKLQLGAGSPGPSSPSGVHPRWWREGEGSPLVALIFLDFVLCTLLLDRNVVKIRLQKRSNVIISLGLCNQTELYQELEID
jgi:hypothetical protein